MSFTSGSAERTRSRWSDVYIASFAQFFGSLSTTLVMVTLILALQRQLPDGRGLELAVLIICEAVPMVILGKLIGRLVDRVDSRILIAVAGAGQIAACLALSQVFSVYSAMLAGAVALSVVSGVGVPARQALLPAMVTREDLPRAIAIGQTAGSAGFMIGPALAGFMVFGIGVAPTLQIAALGFITTIIAAFLLRTRRGGAPAVSAQGEEEQTEWTLRQDRLLWSSVWGLSIVVAALSAVNVVLVPFIMDTLHSTEQVYGVVDSMWTVGLLAGAWIFSRMIKPITSDVALTRWLFTVLGIASAALIAVGGVQHALWIVPFYLIGGLQNGGLNLLAGTLLGRRAPAEARGRASTAMGMRVNAGALLGYLAGGLLLELSEPRWIVIGCGVLGVIAALVVAPLVLRSAGETVRYAEAS